MSQNIQQIYADNPITTNASTDLMYFGQSPYAAGDDAAMQFGDFVEQIAAGTINQIGYFATTGNKVSGITSANNGVLITSNTGVPSLLANSGTPGFVLTANSGAPPSWQAVSASGAITTINGNTGSITPTTGTVTINGGTTGLTTSGSGSTLSLTGTLVVANGGSGRATATAYALLAGGTTATGIQQSLATGTAGQFLQSGGASALPVWTTATFPAVGGPAGNILISDGTNYIASTSLWPNTVGTAGTLLRSNGTSNAYSTSTFADTYAISTLLYASSANTIAGLATANNGLLVTSGTGVPSIGNTIGASITVVGSVQAGNSGNAGQFNSFPTTATSGALVFKASDSAGDYTNILTNLSTSAARTWSLPDATGTIALTGSTVSSITGTASQVLANGTVATPQTGAVTLTLPQDIALTSVPTFGGMLLSSGGDTALSIRSTSVTGIPYIQLLRNTSTVVGYIQPGSTSDGSATGTGFWMQNAVAGGSFYFNISGTGNALTVAPTVSTFLGASDTSINIVSSSATGMPYIQWTNNTSTAINYIQAGTNVSGNASSTGTLFVNNIAGGDFFFNVTGTGNLLTLGISAATFTKPIVSTLGAISSGSSAGGVAGTFTAYSNTTNLGSVSLQCANNAGNYGNVLTNTSTSAARTWTLPDASGTIALTSGSGALTYNSVSGTTQAAVAGNAYILNNAGATTVTLPTTGSSTIGDTIKVKGRSAAPWIIQANTGQTITYGATSSTVAGTATSAAGTDSLQLVYVAADEWSVDWALSAGIVLA